jgi:hypothetical protein
VEDLATNVDEPAKQTKRGQAKAQVQGAGAGAGVEVEVEVEAGAGAGAGADAGGVDGSHNPEHDLRSLHMQFIRLRATKDFAAAGSLVCDDIQVVANTPMGRKEAVGRDVVMKGMEDTLEKMKVGFVMKGQEPACEVEKTSPNTTLAVFKLKIIAAKFKVGEKIVWENGRVKHAETSKDLAKQFQKDDRER